MRYIIRVNKYNLCKVRMELMSKVNQLSLKENFSWNFIGSVVYSASQFIILIMLAKFGEPELVGLYTLGLALTAPIMMFTNLQLRQIQATDTILYFKFGDYFGLRIITSIVAIFITMIVILIGKYDLGKSIIILLVACTKIMDSFSEVVYGQLQQRERMDYIGKSRIIKGSLTVIVIGVSLILTKSLVMSLIFMNIAWFLIFLLYDRRKARLYLENINPDFNFDKLKSLVKLSFPLGIVLMLGSLNTNLPRIIVDKFEGAETLGYFASIAYLLVVGNTFIQAVGQAVAPQLAKLYKNKLYSKFKNMVLKLTLLGFAIGSIGTIIAVFFGELILKIIYDNSYANFNHILVIVMFAGIFTFSSSFMGYCITGMRLFKIQPIIGVLSLLVTLISSIILIPTFGITGAAYTLIFGGCAEFLLKFLVVSYKLKIK